MTRWCEPHYDQFRKGRSIGGLKLCDLCGVEFSHPQSRNTRKSCPDCIPSGDSYAQALRADFGLSRPMYDAMYFEQDGQCARAGCAKEAKVVDHWHRCLESHKGSKGCLSCVRSLLCVGCNVGLHYVEDDSFREAALEYLREYSQAF